MAAKRSQASRLALLNLPDEQDRRAQIVALVAAITEQTAQLRAIAEEGILRYPALRHDAAYNRIADAIAQAARASADLQDYLRFATDEYREP